jgi:hypothetical protein
MGGDVRGREGEKEIKIEIEVEKEIEIEIEIKREEVGGEEKERMRRLVMQP